MSSNHLRLFIVVVVVVAVAAAENAIVRMLMRRDRAERTFFTSHFVLGSSFYEISFAVISCTNIRFVWCFVCRFHRIISPSFQWKINSKNKRKLIWILLMAAIMCPHTLHLLAGTSREHGCGQPLKMESINMLHLVKMDRTGFGNGHGHMNDSHAQRFIVSMRPIVNHLVAVSV